MKPSSAQPSQDCGAGSHPMLLLQRHLSRGNCRKWKTVLRCRFAREAVALVELAQKIDPSVQWRLEIERTET
jgi:hypothetical protein